MTNFDDFSLASIQEQILRNGYEKADLVSQARAADCFDNFFEVIDVGDFYLRVVGDRGQLFIDFSFYGSPEKFYSMDDIDIAMNWKSIEQVLDKREPDCWMDIIRHIGDKRVQMRYAFSAELEEMTKARLERAIRERGKAFVERLHMRR